MEVKWFGPPDGYHHHHITLSNEVSREEFEQAFESRHDVDHRPDGSVQSLGFTDGDRLLELIWRPDEDEEGKVFPITAYDAEVTND